MRFSGYFCCCYSVSHCSNKPTIKIIDWSFLCQWANVQNQQGIKYFFPSLYQHNFPASWCHLFCEVHQSLLQHSTHTTWCCHSCASPLGWWSSACKPPPFSSNHNDGHYGQTVLFLFHQTRGHFSKKYDLCPHVQLQILVWLFYIGFGAVATSLLSGNSGYVDIGLVLLWI